MEASIALEGLSSLSGITAGRSAAITPLQINMTKAIPVEVQLHGYGNEHHGDRKQYRHKIPKKVRDFCDRWEREVLTPWFADQKARATQTKPGKLKKRSHEPAARTA